MVKRDLDRYFPRNGPCMFHPSRYARHRLVDAIKARHGAGETVAGLARDYRMKRAAILAALNSSPDDNRMTAREIWQGGDVESDADCGWTTPPLSRPAAGARGDDGD